MLAKLQSCLILFLNLILIFFSDPDGKERKIYYKADKKGYQVSYDSKKEDIFFLEKLFLLS